MPTNDERREVAKRIREMYYYGGIKRSVAFYEALNDVIMGQDGFGSFQDIADRLADLIEPEERTCTNTCEAIGNTGLPLDGPFTCSECGCHSETWFTTPYGDKWTESPRYCPNCGALVVKEES